MSDGSAQIDQLWRWIEARMTLVASPTGPLLTAGVSEQALERVETALGIALPEDVRVSYRRHDRDFSLRLVTDMDH